MQSGCVFLSEQANIRSGNFLDLKTCLAFCKHINARNLAAGMKLVSECVNFVPCV